MSTSTIDPEVIDEREVDASAGLMAINRSEIDQQVATARRYPRSIRKFLDAGREMVTLSEDIAGECIYSLPRGGKPIEGPSARFAEIVAHAWTNCRSGARVIDRDDKFVTAQGVFIDCEANVAITYEVKRRITNSEGKTFSDDMIGVTSNAACSIALRNSVLKGVPKAFWKQLYDEARKTAIGDAQTLVARRTRMIQDFGKMGVRPEQIFSVLEIKGEEDIGLDHLATLRGVFTAIKEGDTSIEEAFAASPATGSKVGRSSLNDRIGAKGTGNGNGNGNGHKAETVPEPAGEESQVPPEGDRRTFPPKEPATETAAETSTAGQLSANGAELNRQIEAAAGNKTKLAELLQDATNLYGSKAACDKSGDPEGLFIHGKLAAYIGRCKK